MRRESLTHLFRNLSPYKTALKLVPDKDPRIASVGCADGSEPYSILMLNALTNPTRIIFVDGYDKNPQEIAWARLGSYLPPTHGRIALSLFDQARLRPDIAQPSGDGIEMAQGLKDRTTFGELDVSRQHLPQRYPVIICANVLYHYTRGVTKSPDLVDDIISNLANSTTVGGVVITEHHETSEENIEFFTRFGQFVSRPDLAVEVNHPELVEAEKCRVFQRVGSK